LPGSPRAPVDGTTALYDDGVAAFSAVERGAFRPKKAQKPNRWGCVVVGWLIVGFFAAVVCAYGCTEYLLVQLDVWRRMLDRGVRTLVIILAANLMSFAILWVSSLAFMVASGVELYFHATVVCAGAQAVWLGQHLWSYYRDHPRLRYKQ
jgi:hypothetical protein